MDQKKKENLGMVDRVLRIEPQLRETLVLARATRRAAIDDCFRNLSWSGKVQIESDPDYIAWLASTRADMVGARAVDELLGKLVETQTGMQSMNSEVEDAERRELSRHFYLEFRSLRNELLTALAKREAEEAAFDAESLRIAGAVRSKLSKLGDRRMRQIGASAVDTARAVSLLARRIQVVKDHPPTMADASFD